MRERIQILSRIVDLGDKAEAVKDVLDVFLDRREDDVLNALRHARNAEETMRVKMYYNACEALASDIKKMIDEALIKQQAINRINDENRGRTK